MRPRRLGRQPKYLDRFQAGIDSGGVSSPNFDAGAKYLYLYQVVNDRRTVTPLQSVSVKLLVDLKDITSWGYLPGVGFATVTSRPGQEQPVMQPVAFNHVLGGLDAAIMYQRRPAAIPLVKPLSLTRVPTQRGEQDPTAKQKQQPIKVVWDALYPATNPDHVMLLSTSDFDKKPCFRAVWNAANALPRWPQHDFRFHVESAADSGTGSVARFRAPKDNAIKPVADAEAEPHAARGYIESRWPRTVAEAGICGERSRRANAR